jgi:hypothetical protein
MLPQAQASILRRRTKRFNDLTEFTAKCALVDAEEVIHRLTTDDDGEGVSLLEQAAEGALRTADHRKLKVLARVTAVALAGDDSRVMEAKVVLPAILELEPPHVRVIIELSRSPGRDRSSDRWSTS